MKTSSHLFNRRDFTKTTVLAGGALASGALSTFAADRRQKRIRTGLIGCGSVSHQYLPQLAQSPFVEVVSLCDIRYERAKKQGERFKVANTYPNIDAMLAGVPFDFLVDTTDMQEHEKTIAARSKPANMCGVRSRLRTRSPPGRSCCNRR